MEQLHDLTSIPLSDRVFINGLQVTARYGIGRNTLEKVAGEIGAKVKIGRRTLYSRKKFDDWAESLCAGSEGKHEFKNVGLDGTR